MREFASSSISLAGTLLLAHPSLLDSNFRRTVLFLSTNNAAEGSFGMIINRPAGRTVGDLLPEKELGSLSRIPVFLGGPVSADQMLFASFRWHEETNRLECRHHLVIEEASEALQDNSNIVRAFIGYAGWSQGQLEGELAQRSWLVTPPPRELLDLERCPTLWRELTSAHGPWFRLMAEAPDDLSAN